MHEDNTNHGISPTRRRCEIAAILAKAVLRRHRAAKTDACLAAEITCDSPQNCLAPVSTSRLTVPTGSGGYDPRDPEKGRRA